MRHDIQFLRGIAVLSVLLYHAQVKSIINGYLGVDVFFVVSGFLITKIILRELSEDRFSFSEFYLRRAKRLLPALYCTLILTTLLAYTFLTFHQWNDYLNQLIGAITFTSNMVLPQQVGYFEDAADTKPLLHIWSLSLEEQYYFFLPLLLFLTPQKFQGWLIAIIAILSLSLCLFFINWSYTYWRLPNTDSAGWAFYLFPTRAWELLAGSLSAWHMLKFPSAWVPKQLKYISLIGLIALFFIPIDAVHPRGNAMAAIFFTCIMILGRDDWLPRHLIVSSVEKIGDWSYSLYLIHWPLLAFAQVSFLGKVPLYITATLASLSIVLAYLQYHYVEQKFRYAFQNSTISAYKFLSVSTLVLILLPMPFVVSNYTRTLTEHDDPSDLRQNIHGISSACDNTLPTPLPPTCQTDDSPIFAVWGDSYAMHLVPGLLKNRFTAKSMVQITKSVCAPILNIAIMYGQWGKRWAEGCIAHNALVIEQIRATESIQYVILGSTFHQFKLSGIVFLHNELVMKNNRQLAINEFVNTIRKLQEAEKIPIIFAPPPMAEFNIGDCLERQRDNAIIFGRSDCDIKRAKYERLHHDIIAALKEVENRTDVHVIWLDSLMCDDEVCRTEIDDTYLYRDKGHLSRAGSELLLSDLDILGSSGAREVPH